MKTLNLQEIIVFDIIKGVIDKSIPTGSKLPTERELSIKYQTSRHNVRQALYALKEMKVIKSIQGSGNFIQNEIPKGSLLYNSLINKNFDNIESKVINFQKILVGDDLSKLLKTQCEDYIWFFTRTRSIDGRIIQLEETYMPVKLFPDLTKELCASSIHLYVRNLKGYDISHFITEYQAISANSYVAKHLICKKNEPLMHITNIGYLENNIPFELSFSYNIEYKTAHLTSYNEKRHNMRKF